MHRFDEPDKTFKVVLGVWIAWAVICLAATVAVSWFVAWVVVQLLEHFQVI